MPEPDTAIELARVLMDATASRDERLDAVTALRREAEHVEQPEWFTDEAALDALAAAASHSDDDEVAQEASLPMPEPTREYLRLNTPHLLEGIE